MRIRPVKDSDIAALMSWFDSEESCRRWGGPEFEYPFTTESFRRDCFREHLDSFCLESEEGELVGFGQFYEKLNRIHLARIGVRPDRRGNGYGSELMRCLMQAGSEAMPGRNYSLYVYADNEPAIACYRKAGFVDAPPEESDDVVGQCLFMIAQAR